MMPAWPSVGPARSARGWLVVLVLLLAPTRADASFIPILTNPPPTGIFSQRFTYDLVFTTGPDGTDTLQAGDSVTLYDFESGFLVIQVITNPAGLSAFIPLVGPPPPAGVPAPTDSPTIANLTFRYNGPTLTTDTTFSAFVLVSPGATIRLGQYASVDSQGMNGQAGTVLLPTGEGVPESTSLALLGLGVVGLSITARRRFRPSVA